VNFVFGIFTVIFRETPVGFKVGQYNGHFTQRPTGV